MAKTALKEKQRKHPKFAVRAYTRCKRCGRARAVLRRYGVCRLCFRQLAYAGVLPGVKKASW